MWSTSASISLHVFDRGLHKYAYAQRFVEPLQRMPGMTDEG
jgi:hypothetical protein